MLYFLTYWDQHIFHTISENNTDIGPVYCQPILRKVYKKFHLSIVFWEQIHFKNHQGYKKVSISFSVTSQLTWKDDRTNFWIPMTQT